jgi:hypothetical protein
MREAPLIGAASRAMPAARVAAVALGGFPSAIRSRLSSAGPLPIRAAGDKRPPVALSGLRDAGLLPALPTQTSRAGWLLWGVPAVLLALAAAWTTNRLLGPPAPADDRNVETATAPLPPAPAEAPRLGAAELAEAINAELQRIGLPQISVDVATDGTATVRGPVAHTGDRDALVGMIAAVDGVTRVRDALQVQAAAPAAPATVAQAPAPAPPPRVVPTPLIIAKAPAAPPPVPAIVIAPRAPVESVAPPPPDWAQVQRNLERALSQLALGNVTAQVDESMLVTLRGTVNDPAKKAQALAAARAASPNGKVRDLIFVVEE